MRITVLPCYIVSQLILYPSPSPPLPHFTASSRNIVPCLSISHSCMILDTTQHNERLWCWTRSSELHPSVGITKGGLQTHSSAACWSRPGKKMYRGREGGGEGNRDKEQSALQMTTTGLFILSILIIIIQLQRLHCHAPWDKQNEDVFRQWRRRKEVEA